MALENATYINGLNSSNPLSTDVVSQADDHLRLIKQTLLNTFPNITGPVTATQAQINQPVPSGIIAMWSGAIASIPSGWYLCNGANGTPDLRDRFIVGAGSTYAVGATGGSASTTLTTANLPAHTHAITATTDSAGAHTHTITDPGHTHGYTAAAGQNNVYPGNNGGAYATAATTASATTGISINSAGAHTHTITASASSVGSGTAFDTRPPYYALAYIMKA